MMSAQRKVKVEGAQIGIPGGGSVVPRGRPQARLFLAQTNLLAAMEEGTDQTVNATDVVSVTA
jgi:hypothetical protein